ncbi:uncharacterized protein LOC120697620 isoform X1 [Panicum virgatum]|uniref:uncharacterized protein LOC120697620 isoform X1 n=1 Tax=Panicum virgatum TaxID=38727 RepID=UPI0019D51C5C|nr:uncharacterized protein LOC120697620 isoform X1 [Panicum virgatum]
MFVPIPIRAAVAIQTQKKSFVKLKELATRTDPKQRPGVKKRGNTIDLSLSGQALLFDVEAVFDIGQNHHVIAIFVGTLMKIYREDYKFLSGTSACRWYINENDIPEMRTSQRGYYFSSEFKFRHLYLSPILMFR